jgi:hypothetical protein
VSLPAAGAGGQKGQAARALSRLDQAEAAYREARIFVLTQYQNVAPNPAADQSSR